MCGKNRSSEAGTGGILTSNNSKGNPAEQMQERKIALLELFSQVSTSFVDVSSENFSQKMNRALLRFGEHVQADRAYVFKYDFPANRCHTIYEWCRPGIVSRLADLQSVPLDMIQSWVARHKGGQSIYENNVQALDPGDGVRLWMGPQGVKSLISFPMMRESECFGFVGFDTITSARSYTEFEQQMLRELSALFLSALKKKQIEEELRQSEEKYRTLIENLSEIVYIVDNDWHVVYMSPNIRKITDFTMEELAEINILDYVHPEDKQELIRGLQTSLSGQNTITEFRILGKDDVTTWMSIRTRPIYRDGHITGIQGVLNDITERKNLEFSLAASEERFRKLFYEIPSVAVQGYQQDGTVFYWNKASERLYGYSEQEAIGRSITELIIPPQQRAQVLVHLGEMVRTKQARSAENLRMVDKAGNEIPVYTSHAVLTYADNRTELFCVDIDLRDIQQMEEQLFVEKEHFKHTFMSIGDGVLSTDELGNIRYMNQIAETLTGWSQAEAQGRPLEEVYQVHHQLIEPMPDDTTRAYLQKLQSHEPAKHNYLISLDGREAPIRDQAVLIKDRAGNTKGLTIVFENCSGEVEQKRQIERLSDQDALTGLYNRKYMKAAAARLDRPDSLPYSIMTIDINGLKLTNDAFGHEMGDRLLQRVAEIVSKVCRSHDIIGRMGGDEFQLLLPNIDANTVAIIADRICKTADKARLESVVISLAVGFATKTEMDQEIEDIIKESENRMYKNKQRTGKTMRSQTIETVLRNINSKYDQEQVHTERVSQYCLSLAAALGLDAEEARRIETAGSLHDIGKITVSPDLLNKPGRLTPDEFVIVRQHTETGYHLLRAVDEFASLAEAVRHHHERWDGKGYPLGLSKEDIPLISRIIAVADAYEAMTAKRPYQGTRSGEEAARELKLYAGSQFDPAIVDVFLRDVLKLDQV